MRPTKKLEKVIVAVSLLILAAIWALNDYEDTWFYFVLAIITIPASWFFFGSRGSDK